MKNFGFDATDWPPGQTAGFMVVFFLLYGLGIAHFQEFSALYQNPMALLPRHQQWLQESPVQYLIGYSLFSHLNAHTAFLFTQLLGVSFLLASYILLLKTRKLDHSQLFLVLALSPFIFTQFVWFGKADIFLVASCFGMLATGYRHRFLFPIFLLISTFSHPQATVFHLIFFVILRQVRRDKALLLGIITSGALYALYTYKLNADFGRGEYMYDALFRLLKHHSRVPLFDVFSTFGWLWFPIIYYRKSIDWRFYLVATLCFFIAFLTFDHTRVFMLLSLPALVYLAEKVSVVDYAREASRLFPIWILVFFQFQKWNGSIFDTGWSFWLPRLMRIVS